MCQAQNGREPPVSQSLISDNQRGLPQPAQQVRQAGAKCCSSRGVGTRPGATSATAPCALGRGQDHSLALPAPDCAACRKSRGFDDCQSCPLRHGRLRRLHWSESARLQVSKYSHVMPLMWPLCLLTESSHVHRACETTRDKG